MSPDAPSRPSASSRQLSGPETVRRLRRALRLAALGRPTTAPNPRVGCVLVRDGQEVGAGWHQRAGEPHAEPLALAVAGERARGATAYVTLEPCAHHGRTPPCVDALIAAGVARVVACHRDPDPRVAGAGFARLAAAGIAVEVGALAGEAVRLNLPFLVPRILGRPAVTLKWAMSLDGRIATVAGDSRWVSGAAGRRWGLGLREEHDAILVGVGTVLADDPLLTRRLGLAAGPIVRVVLDRALRTPPSASLFGAPGPVRIYTERGSTGAEAALVERGATVVRLAEVAPAAVLADLHAAGVASLLVEGGSGIHGAFVASGLYDRVAVDVAPKLLGGAAAPGPVGGDGFAAIAAAPALAHVVTASRGSDVVVEGLAPGRLEALVAAVT